ncbi:MAG: choice-of-anchor A family protein [Methylococcaceae bacterium]|jgi:choice-of-anchor A domain-containing protein
MRLTTTLLSTLLLGSAISSAHAAFIGPAADYNVFVWQDFTSSNTDAEGNVAAGGNINLQNYSVATQISGSAARLVAGGNVTATNGGVGNGQNGTIYVGGSTALTSFTARGGVLPQSLIDFSAASGLYQSLSTSLGALAANGSTNVNFGSLNLNGANAGLNVFTVNGNDLTNTNTVNISALAGSTVLINVTGSGQTFQNGQVFLTGVDAAHVIYNFSDASSLTLAGSKNPFGTIFAPFANVTGGFGALDGQLVAESFNGNIEFHNVLFAGDLPAGVPVPAAIWLFASGLAVFGGMNRKKRQTKAAC